MMPTATRSVRVDTAPPTVTSDANENWTNSPSAANVKLTATDSGSLINSLTFLYASGKRTGDSAAGCFPNTIQPCGFPANGAPPSVYNHNITFDGSGHRTLTATATDIAGNNSAPYSFSVRLDYDDPIPTLEPPMEASGGSVLELSSSNQDLHSGPASGRYEVCGTSAADCTNDSSKSAFWSTINQPGAIGVQCLAEMTKLTGPPGNRSNYGCQFEVSGAQTDANDFIYIRFRGFDNAGNEAVSNVRPAKIDPDTCAL